MNSHRARALSKRSKGTKAWETTQHKHCLSCVRVAAHGVPSPYRDCKGGPYKLKGTLGSTLPKFILCHFARLCSLTAQESSLT